MKRCSICLVVFLAAAASMSAQIAPDAPEITRLLNEFLAGAGRNDPAVHERFWADDLIYTRSTGVRTYKEEIMKGFKTPAPAPKPGEPVTVYTAEDIQIHQYGDTAVVAFRLVITTTKSDGTKTVGNNLNTGTFVKRKGIWQAVAWQSTVVPESKPAPLASTSTAATPQTTDGGSRVYLKGSKGGCYYLNTSGKKVYVDHALCK